MAAEQNPVPESWTIPEDAALARSIATSAEGRVRDRLTGLAGRLRDLADDVDRATGQLGRARFSSDQARFAHTVRDAEHDVMWTLANLDLPGLALLATEADTWRAIARMMEVSEDA